MDERRQSGSPEQRKSWLQEDIRALSEKVAAYEAGAEPYDPFAEGQKLTPGQLWHKLLGATEQTRTTLLAMLLRNSDLASECFVKDHAGLEQELTGARVRLQGLQERVDSLNTALTHKMGEIAAYQKVLEIQAGPRVEYAAVASPTLDDLPEFQGDRDVREKIGEQLKSAGIDLNSLCRYEWSTDSADDVLCSEHVCDVPNPLHAEAHKCEQCGATLSHEDAERLINNG